MIEHFLACVSLEFDPQHSMSILLPQYYQLILLLYNIWDLINMSIKKINISIKSKKKKDEGAQQVIKI